MPEGPSLRRPRPGPPVVGVVVVWAIVVAALVALVLLADPGPACSREAPCLPGR